MTPAERAEHETFGSEYMGPRLADDHAARLLILMGHASTCPCHHRSSKHRDVCKSTKYLMLHVRDCPGTTSTLDVCPFPWCRKVKHLMYHLVSCIDSENCPICSPKEIPKGLEGLVGLNAHRIKKHREHMIAASKVALASSRAKTIPVPKPTTESATAASAASKVAPSPGQTGPSQASSNEPPCSATAPPQEPSELTTVKEEPPSSHQNPIEKDHGTGASVSATEVDDSTMSENQIQRNSTVAASVDPALVKVEAENESVPGPFASDDHAIGDERTGGASSNLEEDHLLPTPISAMNPHDDHDHGDHHEEMSELLGESPDADPDEGDDAATNHLPAETNQQVSTSADGTAKADVAASVTVSNTEVEKTAGPVKVN